jgi:hypothetical protein
VKMEKAMMSFNVLKLAAIFIGCALLVCAGTTKAQSGVSPEQYGAVGDCVADDTNAFNNALLAKAAVFATPGKCYLIGEIVLTNSQMIDGRNARFKSRSGASFMVKLTNYAAEVKNFYIEDARGAACAIKIADSMLAAVRNINVINGVNPICVEAESAPSSGGGVRKANVHDLRLISYSGTGVKIGKDVSEGYFRNIIADCGSTEVAGPAPKGIPRVGAKGFTLVSTGSTAAYGGNVFSDNQAINCQFGWVLTDATLVRMSNNIADGTSNYGLLINGNTSYVDANSFFVATSRGVRVANTALNINFVGLRTISNGVIPPWGHSTYYSSGNVSGGNGSVPGELGPPYYDFTATDTARARVSVDTWVGRHALSLGSSATVNLTGGATYNFQTATNVAPNSTVYLGASGQSAALAPVWVAPYAGYINSLYVAAFDPPGGVETFTYAVLINGNPAGITKATMGASYGGRYQGHDGSPNAVSSYPINVNAGDVITLRVVTSAGAASTQHRGYIQISPIGD